MFIIPILLIFHDENQTFTAHASLRVGCLAKSNLDTEEFYLFLRSENTWSNLPGHSDGSNRDLPPIDYVAADGKAAGFNTALLAEIAKRLKINIKTVYVNTASRTASLSSGRSDVVFWYQVRENAETKQNRKS